MATPRRAVLLTLLAVTMGILLMDAHGSPRQALEDARQTWEDFRGTSAQPE